MIVTAAVIYLPLHFSIIMCNKWIITAMLLGLSFIFIPIAYLLRYEVYNLFRVSGAGSISNHWTFDFVYDMCICIYYSILTY